MTLIYKNESFKIIGACMEVHIADFVCFDKIILELKTVDNLIKEHEAQVINYLKATGLKLGLLVNFGKEKLEYKRLARNITT